MSLRNFSFFLSAAIHATKRVFFSFMSGSEFIHAVNMATFR
jgi:hypothetical protein